jgi:hypothetical protein
MKKEISYKKFKPDLDQFWSNLFPFNLIQNLVWIRSWIDKLFNRSINPYGFNNYSLDIETVWGQQTSVVQAWGWLIMILMDCKLRFQ